MAEIHRVVAASLSYYCMVAKSAAAFTGQFAARHDVWFGMAATFLGVALAAYPRIRRRKYGPVKLVKDLLLSAMAGIGGIAILLIVYFLACVVYLPVQQAHQLAQLVPTNQKCQSDLTEAHSQIDKLKGDILKFSQLRGENANLTSQVQNLKQEETRRRADDLDLLNDLDSRLGQYMGLAVQIKNNCGAATERRKAAEAALKPLEQARQQAKQQKRSQTIDERSAWRDAAQQLTIAQNVEQQCDKIPNDLVDILTKDVRFLKNSNSQH